MSACRKCGAGTVGRWPLCFACQVRRDRWLEFWLLGAGPLLAAAALAVMGVALYVGSSRFLFLVP